MQKLETSLRNFDNRTLTQIKKVLSSSNVNITRKWDILPRNETELKNRIALYLHDNNALVGNIKDLKKYLSHFPYGDKQQGKPSYQKDINYGIVHIIAYDQDFNSIPKLISGFQNNLATLLFLKARSSYFNNPNTRFPFWKHDAANLASAYIKRGIQIAFNQGIIDITGNSNLPLEDYQEVVSALNDPHQKDIASMEKVQIGTKFKKEYDGMIILKGLGYPEEKYKKSINDFMNNLTQDQLKFIDKKYRSECPEIIIPQNPGQGSLF